MERDEANGGTRKGKEVVGQEETEEERGRDGHRRGEKESGSGGGRRTTVGRGAERTVRISILFTRDIPQSHRGRESENRVG